MHGLDSCGAAAAVKCLLATVFARAAVDHVVRLAAEDAVVPSALILCGGRVGMAGGPSSFATSPSSQKCCLLYTSDAADE